MADFNQSTNMGLPIPIVGVDLGPDWALNINNSMTLLDMHDHSSGKGVAITPAGLNINADLPMNNSNLISARSVRFTPQLTLPAIAPDLACLFVIGADIYYNDGNGNQIRFTQGGSLAGSSGTITGLPSGTASASYNAISGTFVFQSASNTGANIDGASIIIREQVANAKGITLASPTALPADYVITLPNGLPGVQKILTLDASGSLVAAYTIDGVTLQISAGVIGVKPGGITTTELADNSVTTPKIVDQAVTTAKIADANVTNAKMAANSVATANIIDGDVTRAKLEPLGLQASANNGSYTNTTATFSNITGTLNLTTTGRPVMVCFQPFPGTIGQVVLTRNTASASAFLQLNRDGTNIAQTTIAINAANSGTTTIETVSASSFVCIDTPPAGTHAYRTRGAVISATLGETLQVSNYQMVVYEL